MHPDSSDAQTPALHQGIGSTILKNDKRNIKCAANITFRELKFWVFVLRAKRQAYIPEGDGVNSLSVEVFSPFVRL